MGEGIYTVLTDRMDIYSIHSTIYTFKINYATYIHALRESITENIGLLNTIIYIYIHKQRPTK